MKSPTTVYHDIIEDVLAHGSLEPNRTEMKALTIAGAQFVHDCAEGFPAITTKQLFFKSMMVELEGFIKGITDKNWYRERNCNIWNQWCRPDLVAYGHGEEKYKQMEAERDLGPIYGFQWRHFNAPYVSYDTDYTGQGVDQLKQAIETLRKDPRNRRVLVQAWNPVQNSMMALPPCHFGFQLTITEGRLNLLWNQRSCDLMLGIPFNISSYAVLQHLIARDLGIPVGRLVGQLNDVHIYEPHIENAKLQLSRDPEAHKPPQIITEGPTSLFEWDHTMTKLVDYTHDPAIKFEIAI